MGVWSLSDAAVNDNTALGYYSLQAFRGSNATVIGASAATSATTATYLTAIGKGAGTTLIDQGYNSFLGYNTGGLTIGEKNTFLGAQAGYYAGDVDDCIAVGYNAMLGAAGVTNATCDYNNDPTGTHDADANIVAGARVTGTGIPAGAYIVSITDSTHFELSTATTGGAVTNGTLPFFKTSGNSNIAIGSSAMASVTTGGKNVAIGGTALDGTTDGTQNTAGGYGALSAVCADNSTAIGYNTLNNFTGSSATAIGSGAADAATIATFLTAVGKNALGACTEGIGNTAVGSQAGE